ncbi:PepSY domain-containing protein [bacterium]|nr:PepSY domain-containing protein [bacterium]
MGRKTEKNMRTYHRYLGFFLAGIMAVYAISGIVLTFRNTDYLKKEVHIEKKLRIGLEDEALGSALGKRGFKIDKQEGDMVYFKGGTYNKTTGQASYTEMKMPVILDNMNNLHKMHSGHPLYWLNIIFGIALLFFSVSAFWMFRPKTPVFKKGLYFALGGMILTVILLFV